MGDSFIKEVEIVYVVLRSGKTLMYNDGGTINMCGGVLSIHTKDEEGLIVRFSMDVVERAEFEKPCRVMKARRAPRKGNY